MPKQRGGFFPGSPETTGAAKVRFCGFCLPPMVIYWSSTCHMPGTGLATGAGAVSQVPAYVEHMLL